jgi:hypothetical protein
MTDWSVIVNLNPKTALSHGRDQRWRNPGRLRLEDFVRPEKRAISHTCGGVRYAAPSRHYELSEAIHVSHTPRHGLLRCARNDGGYSLAYLATHCARGLLETPLPDNRRVQEMPGACCTRGLVCNDVEDAHTSIQVQRSTPAFPAQWFDGLCRALPGDEFLLPPSLPA